DVDEEPTDVDVLPLRVGTDCARAPHATSPPLEEAKAVDAFGVENVLSRLVDIGLEASQSAHDLVGRGLVHAALDVAARVDARDEARRREHQTPRRRSLRRSLGRVEDFYPRVIDGGILAVEPAAELAYLVHRTAFGRVEHGDAVAEALGVCDEHVGGCR